MQTVYIGIDDTDVLDGPGTGHMARGLAEHFETIGLGQANGVTRHQLLVDPRIPYTSHNSAKCIELRTDTPISELQNTGVSYMREHFQDGSDPGICVCRREDISETIVTFGRRAMDTLLSKDEALEIVGKENIFLQELGGTGDGIIGALAAVGLRADGNEGRFVQLKGIKEITGRITVGEILATTDIISVVDGLGQAVRDTDIVDSLDWIRPSLVNCKPILRLKQTGNGIWQTIEQKYREHADREGSKR